jgi:hypothetical protein
MFVNECFYSAIIGFQRVGAGESGSEVRFAIERRLARQTMRTRSNRGESRGSVLSLLWDALFFPTS